MTTREQRTAETRARLLEVARVAFERDGYDAVTFRNLAKSAGVSTGSFFSHVKDKAQLFTAATGLPAPDVPAFLERVAIATSGYPNALGDLADDALALRRWLVGSGR